MTNNSKILFINDESRRREYNTKSLAELKRIGKKRDLLNVDQYKKADKNVLIERLVKDKQLSDESKDVLLEQAKNIGLKVNASMSKKDILQKISDPKFKDFKEIRLRELAKKGGIPLRSQMTDKAIIQRLENPTNYYTVESLKRLARDNNIDVRRNIKKPELINILGERNLITTTPIKAQESNLGVAMKNIPVELRRVVKKKARSAKEEVEDYNQYIKNLNKDYTTPTRLKKLGKQLEKKIKKAVEEHKRIFTPIKEASAFKNFTVQYVINGVPFYDAKNFLKDAKPAIINIMKSNGNIKVKLYLNCLMKRIDSQGFLTIKKFAFHSIGNKTITEGDDPYEIYEEMVDEIEEKVREVEEAEGSGWIFVEVENLTFHTSIWDPLNGSSYIPLDPYLANKKALINMQNDDDKCFMWSVLRALYPKDKNPQRIDKDLKSKQDSINMKGIHYPVDLKAIDRFETQNPNISISVVGYNKDDRVHPLKVSKYTEREHDIVLLLIKEAEEGENGEIEEKTHYTLVKNKSALISTQVNNHKGSREICLNCFNSYNCPETLAKHKESCYNNNCVKIDMPPKGSFMEFKNFHHSKKAPFVIYGDFESLIKHIHNCSPNPNKSYTKKIQKHKPISFCYYILCSIEGVYKPIKRVYTQTKEEDADAIDVFIKWLEEDVKTIANIEHKEMIFTEEDQKQFNKASDCWICGEALGNDRVRDHCHYTGHYRGAAHNSCNLKYKQPKSISMFFHNLSGYDSHLFIKKLGVPLIKMKI